MNEPIFSARSGKKYIILPNFQILPEATIHIILHHKKQYNRFPGNVQGIFRQISKYFEGHIARRVENLNYLNITIPTTGTYKNAR